VSSVQHWVGLGANVGDGVAMLRRACRELARFGTVQARSRIYSSEPIGGPPQPPFVNAVVRLESPHDPPALLGHLLDLESELGRDRRDEVRWGPRTIDLDLLLSGDGGREVLTLPGLELPHPRLAERAFALAGVVELSPELVHPLVARPMSALLRDALKQQAVAPTGARLE
jgi:2-amino-4-hydroxy-6-hydroxymethyldihydropteridine diphosphokinase